MFHFSIFQKKTVFPKSQFFPFFHFSKKLVPIFFSFFHFSTKLFPKIQKFSKLKIIKKQYYFPNKFHQTKRLKCHNNNSKNAVVPKAPPHFLGGHRRRPRCRVALRVVFVCRILLELLSEFCFRPALGPGPRGPNQKNSFLL